MELEVRYPSKTIKLWLETDVDVETITDYLDKIRVPLYYTAEKFKTDVFYVYKCKVEDVARCFIEEEERKWYPYATVVYSYNNAVIIPDSEHFDICLKLEPFYEEDDP